MSDLFKGYKGNALEILKKYTIRVWSECVVKTTRGEFKGIMLPRSENDDENHLVLKLASGYNIGISTDTIKDITEHGYKEAQYQIPEKEFPFSNRFFLTTTCPSSLVIFCTIVTDPSSEEVFSCATKGWE